MEKFLAKKEQKLVDFISENLKISKKKAKSIIDEKNVFVNNKRVWIASHIVQKGDNVEVNVPEKKEKWNIKNNIIYEDNFIIAVNKPPFVESERKKGSVEDILREYNKDRKILAIHRLDRETSGVLLFAKNKNVFEKFKKLWQKKDVKKLYLAISHNEATFKKKVINEPVDKKYAKSFVYTKNTKNGFSLFEIEIITGRKHQIRIHLAKIRYPIVGDKVYGLKNLTNPLIKNVKRQMLHASEISFFHPFLKKKIKIYAPPPSDFESFKKLAKL
jgi:RluA family pseudouridine synthase